MEVAVERCQYLDEYCYVCGRITPRPERKSGTKQERPNLMTPDFKIAYLHYFDEPDLFDQYFTPNTVCKSCYTNLLGWKNHKVVSLKIGTPVQWVKDEKHRPDRCYTCQNYKGVRLLNKKNLKSKVYTAYFTASLPLPPIPGIDPPRPPSPSLVSTSGLTESSANTGLYNYDYQDLDYVPDEEEEDRLLSQNDMDYLVAKLKLSQLDSQFLTTFLKQMKMTEAGVNPSAYRQRQAELKLFYTLNETNTFTYCNDIEGLVNKIGMKYDATEWRLFIDGSTTSLKAVLLHVTNKKPSIPLAYGIGMQECYETLKDITTKINYFAHEWKICCDLKVINILQGIIRKGGYPKFFCFKCNWDSRSPNQYEKRDWEPRDLNNQRELNLVNEPIIHNHKDILLPPLHIKLGIAKKFIERAVLNDPEVFTCLKQIFPKISNDKIKAGM